MMCIKERKGTSQIDQLNARSVQLGNPSQLGNPALKKAKKTKDKVN